MKRNIAICVIVALITSFLFQFDVLADADTSGLTDLFNYYNGSNYYDFYYAPADNVQVYQFYKLLTTGSLGMKERSASIVFVSDQPTTMTVTQVFNKKTASTSTVNINTTYSGEYSNASASSYWQSYIGQFLDDDTYDDFVEQMQEKNLYFGFYDTSSMSYYEYYTNMNTSEHYFNCELQKLEVYPQVDGEKLYEDKISTLRDNYYSNSVIDHVAPFWYVPTNKDKPPYLPDDKNGDSSSDLNRFVVYRECVAVTDWGFVTNNNTSKLTNTPEITYKNNFTWEVEKYPELANTVIEVRACPLLQWEKNTGNSNSIDWFYFASPDVNKAKSIQTTMPIIEFSQGLAIGYRKTLDNYYYNWFQRMLNTVTNVWSSHYVWQVRAVSLDGSVSTDWCTFFNDALGTTISGTSDIYINDDGDTNGYLSDDINYNSDKVSNGTKIGDNSSTPDTDINYTDNTANMIQFVGWLRNMLSSIGDFPRLLAIVYSWLPNQLIMAITVTMSFVIILRVLGR